MGKVLIRFVRTSVLDESELKRHYDAYLERRRAEQAIERLSQIWQKYFHRTLRDTEPGFSDALINAVNEDMKYIPLSNIDEVLKRLEDAGNINAAQKILVQLERDYPEKIENFEGLFGPLKFEKLRMLVEDHKKKAAVDLRSLDEVIDSAVSKDFVQLRDRQRLAQFEAKDLVAYFTSVERDHLTGYMRQLAKSTVKQGGDEYDRKINKEILDAAEMIAATSAQNRSRMEAMELIGPKAPRLKPLDDTPASKIET